MNRSVYILGQVAIVAVALVPIHYIAQALPRFSPETIELVKVYVIVPVTLTTAALNILFRMDEVKEKIIKYLAVELASEYRQRREVEDFLRKKRETEAEARAKRIAEATAKAAASLEVRGQKSEAERKTENGKRKTEESKN